MLRRLLLTTAARGAPEKSVTALKDEAEALKDPFQHFRAFKSMDEYVGVTLVQYDNQSEHSASNSSSSSSDDSRDTSAGGDDAGKKGKPHSE